MIPRDVQMLGAEGGGWKGSMESKLASALKQSSLRTTWRIKDRQWSVRRHMTTVHISVHPMVCAQAHRPTSPKCHENMCHIAQVSRTASGEESCVTWPVCHQNFRICSFLALGDFSQRATWPFPYTHPSMGMRLSKAP